MRVKGGTVTRARRKGWIKLAKGYFGHKSIGYKVAKQAVVKSWTYAFRDRKQVKRQFRKMWIARINAATINRKMLSELAIQEPKVFSNLIKIAKDAK